MLAGHMPYVVPHMLGGTCRLHAFCRVSMHDLRQAGALTACMEDLNDEQISNDDFKLDCFQHTSSLTQNGFNAEMCMAVALYVISSSAAHGV